MRGLPSRISRPKEGALIRATGSPVSRSGCRSIRSQPSPWRRVRICNTCSVSRQARWKMTSNKAALLTLCLVLASSAPALAQPDVAEFYKGKMVRIVVGIGVGSGYDINARLIARFLPAYIPGNPTVIVQNQPGAGSLTMTNQLYANGPFDGTVIGASFNGMPTTPLLQPGGARFDPVKLQWIGSSNRETHVTYLWHTAPIASFEEIRTREVVVGAQAPGSTQ